MADENIFIDEVSKRRYALSRNEKKLKRIRRSKSADELQYKHSGNFGTPSERSSRKSSGSGGQSDASVNQKVSEAVVGSQDEWDKWESLLVKALAPLYSAGLVSVAEMEKVGYLFKTSATHILLQIFLAQKLQSEQVKIIRELLRNPPAV